VIPSVSASLRQRAIWGEFGVDAGQALGVAGGLGGTTVNRTIGGFVQLSTLLKGLILELAPRYSSQESHDDRIDTHSVTVPLFLTYRFTNWLALVASYTFFRQRVDNTVLSSSGTPLAGDVDQHRVSVGIQVDYPIRFD
jgi:Autotransporter beta-domain